jgi:hypothetical protein
MSKASIQETHKRGALDNFLLTTVELVRKQTEFRRCAPMHAFSNMLEQAIVQG